jgi:creatinine amidohydrolase
LQTNPNSGDKVLWAELRPDEFRVRCERCPVVYLPLGLCEPHGHVAALGLDLIKADYYCREAARRFGGIVAPSQGYHIHEAGFHAPWLAEVVGEENAMMAAIPPHVMLRLFLYQLRAFALAGFRAVIAISGHSGGSQEDLRRVATAFTAATGIPVVVKSDPECIPHLHGGDHAGRYEISQLLAIRPDLVDLSLLQRAKEPGSGGRMALGDDAGEADAVYGRMINEAIIGALGEMAAEANASAAPAVESSRLTYAVMEKIWAELEPTLPAWMSVSPKKSQALAPAGSKWKIHEQVADVLSRSSR